MITRSERLIPDSLVQVLRAARRIAVLTGAGISAESGIPTFRNAPDGLWSRYDPMELVSVDGFRRNPKLVWEWHTWLRDLVKAAEPNAAHRALAKLEQRVPHCTVITQNIDDLHQRAGSREVIRLHGDLFETRCSREGRPLSEAELDHTSVLPRCPCGAYARPGEVWFGEMLPPGALEAAAEAMRACDLCLVVGTSAVVQPAASLVDLAPAKAIRVVINPERTEHAIGAGYLLQATAGTALPLLVDAAFPDPA
ncbi:MAG TPA: NAD-dependent deacylase [Armatimonadetes bacterium]|jgi:NAD-dependent deacetylase|nr:NAD-dependent deacylase [Armatimonadota bacterium]